MKDYEVLACWTSYRDGMHVSDIAEERGVSRNHVQWAIDEFKRWMAEADGCEIVSFAQRNAGKHSLRAAVYAIRKADQRGACNTPPILTRNPLVQG